MTKVLHVNCNYGDSLLHQQLIEHLEAIGCENKVFLPVYYGKEIKVPCHENVAVTPCFHKIDRLFFHYKQAKIIQALDYQLPVSDFDCFHAHTVFTDGNCVRQLARKYGRPYLVAVRNTDLNTFFKKAFYLRGRGLEILRGAARIIFLSPAYKERLFAEYIPRQERAALLDKSLIIPNGIADFWQESGPFVHAVPGPVVKLLFAGTVEPNKNIGTIQKAMDFLSAHGVQTTLTVVGQVVDKNEYQCLAQHERTTFVEKQNPAGLQKLFRQHDIFVMTSFHETFGLVYAEALSQGLPIIYSQNEGFDSQFPEGYVGYHADPHNYLTLAEKIQQVIAEYPRLTAQAQPAASTFAWQKIANNYNQIYSEIVAAYQPAVRRE